MLFAQDAQKKLKRKNSAKKQPPPTIADVLKKAQETFSSSKKPKVDNSKPAPAKKRPATPSTSTTNTTTTQAKPLEGEEDFVRGALPYVPVPRKDLSQESDVLFGNKPDKKKKVKKPKVETKQKEEQPEKKTKSLEESKYRLDGPLAFANVSVGVKVLACVKMILESDLVLSLPGNLTAFMSVREVSDQIATVVDGYINSTSMDASVLPNLNEIFKVGQLLRTVVLFITPKGADTKKRLEVSMRPSLVNRGLTKAHLTSGMALSGSVKSLEEKGYLIDLGIGEDGFLPFSKSGSETRYTVGHPLDLAVVSVGRAIGLSAEAADVAGGLIKNDGNDQTHISMDTLLPGMMVQARLVKSHRNNLQLRFLDVLNGVVDLQHLPDAVGANEDLTKLYNENTAPPTGYPVRVLYVDPVYKHVRLTMKPELLAWQTPKFPEGIKVGDIITDALVVRVESGRGVTVQLAQGTVQGFAHKSAINQSQREHLSKHFVVGSTVPCRVTGLQLIDGIMVVSLDPEVIHQKIFGIRDLAPGQFVEGKVQEVTPAGVLVRISPQVKGFIPLIHLNDSGEGGLKAYTVGGKVEARVLGVGDKTGRVFLTAKKTLKNKSLPLLTSYDNVAEGFVTFGVVHAIKEHGLVVQFFNGVAGFLSIRDLRRQHVIREDQGIGEAYSVGQLVQVNVAKALPAQRKLFLALAMNASTGLQVGQLVEGTVTGSLEEEDKQNNKAESPTPTQRKFLLINVTGYKGSIARLESTHLTDHPYFSSRLFRSLSSVGTKLDALMVLRIERDGVVLTAKPSLLQAAAAKKLPTRLSEVQEGDILNGYVKNITEHGIFVSFLGNFTGLAPRKFISEQFVASPYDHFQAEQSVRVKVESIDATANHVVLNLRASAVVVSAEEEGKLLDTYLIDRARAEAHELLEKNGTAVDWSLFPVGSLSTCKVLGVKEFGILGEVYSTKSKPVTCLAVRPRHSGTSEPEMNSTLPCRILDQERVKSITDISFRPELLQAAPPSVKLAVGSKTSAVIQLVKANHFVLTLPSHGHAPALALTYTLNMRVNPHSLFQMGTQTEVLVSAEPKQGEPVRVIVDANRKIRDKLAKGTKTRTEDYFDKSIQRLKHLEVGRVVLVKLQKLQDHSVKVAFSNNDYGLRGQVHISEIEDLPADPREWRTVRPLQTVSKLLGTLVQARILAVHTDKKNSHLSLDLTLRTSALVEDADIPQPIALHRIRPGRIVSAYVISVEPEENCAWVDLSRLAKGKIEGLDFAHDASLKHLLPHTPVRCVVTGLSAGKVTLRLAQEGEIGIAGDQKLKDTIMTCQVVQIVPGRGLKVRIDSADGRVIWGLVHITDLSDSWPADPLGAYHEGQIVKAFALDDPTETKGDGESKPHLLMHLSLRPSRLGKAAPGATPEISSANSLTVGQLVKGYVKLTNKKGCWISLGREVEARVLIKNLDDGFVRDPEKQFPPGKLVVGRVTDVNDGKVDVSLRTSTLSGVSGASGGITFKDLKEGKIIKGAVTSIQTFGVFIRIMDSNVSGLCHISNISDTPVTDIKKHYNVGDLVRAKIMKLEPDKKRVSLGLKSSLLAGEEESDAEGETPVGANDEAMEAEGDDEGDEGDEGEDADLDEEAEDDDNEPLPMVNANDDDVPPLPIFSFTTPTPSLLAPAEEDESEEDEGDESGEEGKVNAKASRRAKASAKKRAEAQLSKREEELLDPNRTPETAEDFKRLLASSPDSSFLWIKLMAFHVGITELDKARAVAEQALKTINFRELQEKWNVWIALMNLENLYGNAESLKQVFDRAKERNDPKKVTMELCKMYEASAKFPLAEEAFEAAVKQFGTSGKVWYNYALFFYRRKELDKARTILPRALDRLVKRKHLKLIRKMAQAEYTLGTAERGRTIMEGVMSSYPKRVDLWSTYLDMEIKHGKAAGFSESTKVSIRRLFERIVHLDLKPRKMKFFFKRYLAFEKDHGDTSTQHHVKELAQSYVDKVIKAA